MELFELCFNVVELAFYATVIIYLVRRLNK